MPRSLRIQLLPLRLAQSDASRLLLDGALLCFGERGKGTSKAEVGAKVPATLSLEMTFLDSARKPLDTEQRPFATLEGQITFRDARTPVFSGTLNDAGEPEGLKLDPQAHDEAPEGATSRRVLRFAFDVPDFEQVPKLQELVIKLDPERFRFMELRAKLAIAGDVEADLDVNDVLDIAITPKNPPPLLSGVTIGIHPPLFDEVPPHATLVITPSSGKPLAFALDSGVDRGDGLLSFTVENPEPGVLYTAEMRVSTNGSGTVLFKDVELHQLVAESEGADPTPLSTFGADTLAFESAIAEPPPGEAIQGGPEETSDEQLASLDAQSGNVAVA